MGVFQFPYGKADNSNNKGEKTWVKTGFNSPMGKSTFYALLIIGVVAMMYQFHMGKSTFRVEDGLEMNSYQFPMGKSTRRQQKQGGHVSFNSLWESRRAEP